MYLVKCISAKGASVPKTAETNNHVVNNWAPGQIDYVEDSQINRYIKSTDVFTILGQSGVVGSSTGLESVAGLTAVNNISVGGVNQTTFTLAAVALSITDALAYAGKKLFTFPQGRLDILGCVASLAFAVTTARASTINDSASMTYGLGSAAASNVTLATTMQDILPVTTKLLDGAVAAYTTASKAALAASAQWDGRTTAVPFYLNASFVTGTDIDADGAIAINGSFTVTWVNLGNN